MNTGVKFAIALAGAVGVSGCTAEEMHAFTIGLAAAADELAYQNSLNAAYGPTYCDYGYTLELGYDSYGNRVRFCAYNGPYYDTLEHDLVKQLQDQPLD